MKMRTLFLGLLLTAGVTGAFAQNDQCTTNSSIARAAANSGNYQDAYEPNMTVLRDCPTLRYYHYTDGIKILKSFLADKNSADYDKYFKELMDLRDAQMKYAPEFATRQRGVPSPTRLLAEKAGDYLEYAKNPDIKQAYQWYKESVEAEKTASRATAILAYVQMSKELVKADKSFADTFFADYLAATKLAEEAANNAADEEAKKNWDAVKENLVAEFINSGVADCESLQNIYGPRVEDNKSNREFLVNTISILSMMGCRESQVYTDASFYMYQIEPTAEAAVGVAYRYYKNGDYDEAVKYFDEAIGMEEDDAKKAEMAYAAAAALLNGKKLAQARNYCNRAINFKSDFGQPYILIAMAYAQSPNWTDDGAMNRLTYSLCIDKLQRAISVDPSCEEQARQLIRQYSGYLPSQEDLFMQGVKAGERITIGGWIGESTTVRTR